MGAKIQQHVRLGVLVTFAHEMVVSWVVEGEALKIELH